MKRSISGRLIRHANGKIKIFDVRKGEIVTHGIEDSITGMDETIDEKCLLITTKTADILLYEITTGNILKTYNHSESQCPKSMFNFEYEFFVAAFGHDGVCIYSLLDV